MLRHRVQHLRRRLARHAWLSDLPAMLAWAAIVGVSAAFTTIGFHRGMHLIQHLATGDSGSIVAVMTALPWYGRLLFPALGGLAAGLLLWLAARLSAGQAADYMEAVAIGDGRLSLGHGLLRSGSSLLTVASGGSIGREGAMVHLGAMAASAIGRFARFSTFRLRLLVACGAAAGVAAAYGAPLAGALFVAEIVLGSMAMQSLGPLLIAAASANLTMRMTGHYQSIYAMPGLVSVEGLALLPFVALGLIAGLAAPAFLKVLALARTVFRRSGLALPWRLGLGGALLGLVLIWHPEVAGNGYSVVSALLHDPWSWQLVVLVLALKVLATALTVGSGAIGGVFTPALFVGAALGTLLGMGMDWLWPELGIPLPMATLVGMGSFLGAATSAPLMALLMIFEMSLSYQIVLPLMMACVVAYFVSRAVAEVAMYDVTRVRAHHERMRQQFSHTTLDALIRPATTVVRPADSVRAVMDMFVENPVRTVYVVDEDNVYQGAIARQDLTRLMLNDSGASDRPATEVLRRDYVRSLHKDMTLVRAQEYFVQHQGERLPVVSREARPRLLGVVYKSAVLEKYSGLKRDPDLGGEAFVPSRRRAGRRKAP
ncbi:MAG: ClcB-like voltage-gated chloride channel protein [Castellaniella sp.]